MKIFLTVVCLLMVVMGCKKNSEAGHSHGVGGHDHDHGQDHDHGEELKTRQVTTWSPRYEVFYEFQPPISGKPASFITHVTDLNTWRPRVEGPVMFLLRQGEISFEHPQAAPSRPGIYLPAIRFPSAGDWEMTLNIPSEGKLESVPMGKVTVFASEKEARAAEVPQPPEGIGFLKEQQWKILSETQRVQKRDIQQTIRLGGIIKAKPGTMAHVVAPVPGRVQLPSENSVPLPGESVKAGELLVLLKPIFSEQGSKLLDAEAEVIRGKAALDQAQRTFDRVKKLVDEDAKPKRELEEAEFSLQSAQASYQSAQALQNTYRAGAIDREKGAFNFEAIELRAPISGTISHVGSDLGESVSSESTLFTILNSQTAWVEVSLPENRITQVSPKPPAQILMENHPAIPLRFVFFGMQVDPSTRTVPIVFELDNQEQRFRIGQGVSLELTTSRAEKTLAVPEGAIVEEENRPVVFVQVSGETFEKRDVVLGIRGRGWIQVLQGIQEGERVVTKGGHAIRLASLSSVIPAHGHAH